MKELTLSHDNQKRQSLHGFRVLALMAAAYISAPAFAQPAPQPPMNCVDSPYPPDDDGYQFIPYHLDSRRFAFSWPYYSWDQRYSNNLDYTWQMWFNANVTSVQFVFEQGSPQGPDFGPGSPGFETEACCDFLRISGAWTMSLSGNLDQDHTVEYTTAPISPSFVLGSVDNYVNIHWKTDYSITYQGWALKGVKVNCGITDAPATPASNVSRLHDNGEREGVLLGTGDIRYYSTVQEANQYIMFHLKPDTKTSSTNHADYDLYADVYPNNTPGPGLAQYASTRGLSYDSQGILQMDEDYILIPPTGITHYVYYSVYAYNEDANFSGGYRVYDNTITNNINLRVATDFDYRTPTDFTNLIRQDLWATTGAIYQTTDGTARIVSWDLWNNEPTCGGQGCHIVLSTGSCFGSAAYCCCTTGCNFAGARRVVDCVWQGQSPFSAAITLAHELGHCMYNFLDEYNVSQTGTSCGHSIMADPWQTQNTQDYCTGNRTTGNHGFDQINPDAPLRFDGNWTDIHNCFPSQTAFYTPQGTPPTADPETWADSDIWQYITPIYFRN
jgi:hypothetical protein